MDVALFKLGLVATGILGLAYLLGTGLAQLQQILLPLLHALGCKVC